VFSSAAITVRSAKAHARVTNNLRELAGIDGRSADGKRYRDLLDMAVEEYGMHDPIRLRELAALRFSLEKVQEAVVGGDVLRAEDQVRLANLISRREKELRAKQRQREVEPPAGLRDRLGSKYGGLAP
jgi:hypothetical protein